jgi:antirestriction protein
MTTTTTARVYVGTYAKYNGGSITGKWLDCEDYSDHNAFIGACKALHADEPDPELMFQDYEGPAAFYAESAIDPALWDWLELDEDDRELLAVYQEHVDESGDIETARDSYQGTFDSPSDWAADWLESTGSLSEIPETLRNHFDFEAYARDAGFDGYVFARHDGSVWVFSPV